jgi:5-hydroxyisourate hydrolase-like protein (transthyretin family)
MKKITFFAIIALIVSFLGSCKKDPLDDLAEDEARLQGLVLEKGSKKPIEGATLYLYNCECSIVFGGGCHCTLIDSFKTGKDGRYSFTYKYKGQFDGNSFELRAKATNQYYKKSGFETIGPTDHLIIDYNVEFIPKAWVKIHIIPVRLIS